MFTEICLWPCGTWCFPDELGELLTFMSDDYQRLPAQVTDQGELFT